MRPKASKILAAPIAFGDAGAAASCIILDLSPSTWVWIWVVGMWLELLSTSSLVGESMGVCVLSCVTAKKKVKITYSATRGGRSRIQGQDAFRLIK